MSFLNLPTGRRRHRRRRCNITICHIIKITSRTPLLGTIQISGRNRCGWLKVVNWTGGGWSR